MYTPFAMITSVSVTLRGFKPFEMVGKVPDVMNLVFAPLEQFANTYNNYLELPKEKN